MLNWYTEPGINDTRNILEFFQFVNTTADNLFFPFALLTIWIVTFIAMLFSGSPNRPSAAKGMIFASFFTTILGIILGLLELMNMNWVYLSIVIGGFGVIWIILENSKE